MKWVSGEVVAGAEATGIAVEVHIEDVISQVAWDEVSGFEGAPSQELATGLCIVTLSGATRMDVFERIQDYWKKERRASEYDEMSGFIP